MTREELQDRLDAYLAAELRILQSQDYQVGDGATARRNRRADLEQLAVQEEARMRAAGKSPHEIYDKTSSNYLGLHPLSQGPSPYQLQQSALEKVKAQGNKDHPLNKAAPTSPDLTTPRQTSDIPAEIRKQYPTARRSPKDGNIYVEQDGKYFMVDTPRPPMSR